MRPSAVGNAPFVLCFRTVQEDLLQRVSMRAETGMQDRGETRLPKYIVRVGGHDASTAGTSGLEQGSEQLGAKPLEAFRPEREQCRSRLDCEMVVEQQTVAGLLQVSAYAEFPNAGSAVQADQQHSVTLNFRCFPGNGHRRDASATVLNLAGIA